MCFTSATSPPWFQKEPFKPGFFKEPYLKELFKEPIKVPQRTLEHYYLRHHFWFHKEPFKPGFFREPYLKEFFKGASNGSSVGDDSS